MPPIDGGQFQGVDSEGVLLPNAHLAGEKVYAHFAVDRVHCQAFDISLCDLDISSARMGQYLQENVGGQCWGAAGIAKLDIESDREAVSVNTNWAGHVDIDSHPWSLVSEVDVSTDAIGLPSKVKRPDEQTRAEAREDDPNICRFYLPLSGCSSYLSGISGLLLGGQIFGIVLIGFGFAFGGGLGLFWAFDDPNHGRRRLGRAIIGPCFLLSLTFYGWGWLGHPLMFWGLTFYGLGLLERPSVFWGLGDYLAGP